MSGIVYNFFKIPYDFAANSNILMSIGFIFLMVRAFHKMSIHWSKSYNSKNKVKLFDSTLFVLAHPDDECMYVNIFIISYLYIILY
jgi:hypothetical protein